MMSLFNSAEGSFDCGMWLGSPVDGGRRTQTVSGGFVIMIPMY